MPSYYEALSPSISDVVEAWQLPWPLANVIKYVARHTHKWPNNAEAQLADITKAQDYLERYASALRARIASANNAP